MTRQKFLIFSEASLSKKLRVLRSIPKRLLRIVIEDWWLLLAFGSTLDARRAGYTHGADRRKSEAEICAVIFQKHMSYDICLCQMMSYSKGICHMPKSFVIWHMPLADEGIFCTCTLRRIWHYLTKAYAIWQMTLAYDICLWNMTSSDKGIWNVPLASICQYVSYFKNAYVNIMRDWSNL